MANEIRPKYDCTQSELYAICTLGWSMCKSVQAIIEASFPEYTVAYIDGKLADIITVQQIPDFQARNLITETDHILLGQLAIPAIKNWDFLERYIIRSFQTNKPLIKPNVEAAGKPYYEASTRENPNWEDLKQMLINGNTYITDNAAVLAPVMPAGFPVTYGNTKTAFENKYNSFMVGTVAGPGGTSAKIIANNNLYDEFMLMLGDLYTVTPPATQNQITFTYIKGIISSPGPAGLKGTITDAVTGDPLEGVLLRLTPTGNETTTGPDGKYDFGNIPSGKYDLEISFDNYQTRHENITIHNGVTSTRPFTLTAGGNGITAVRESDILMGQHMYIDTIGINHTPATMVIMEVTTPAGVRFGAAANTTNPPGPIHYDKETGSITLTFSQFLTFCGFGPGMNFLIAQNIGMVTAHFKLTFTNLQP